jgi:hypothetical protein
VVVALALVRSRRVTADRPSTPAARRRTARLFVGAAAAGLVVVGGWWAVLAIGSVAALTVRRRPSGRLVVTRPGALPLVVLVTVGAVVLLGLLGDRGPDAATGPFGLAAQLLLLVALASVVLAGWPDRSRAR